MELNGILCIDKPQGFTSFDVIAKMRGILKTKKLGHAGTLDPMATGVLPVFAGRATRACDLLSCQGKRYTASFRLGQVTDTQDSSGRVLQQSAAACTQQQVERAAAGFVGEGWQLPPMYSAIKVNGRRLYDLARQGVEVEREPRRVFFYEIRLIRFDEQSQTGELDVFCSKGTYIRTLCHDMGQKLGCGAVMTALRRTFAAGFSLAECVSLSRLEELAQKERVGEILLPVQRAFESYRPVFLSQKQAHHFLNGVKLTAELPGGDAQQLYTVWGPQHMFLGLGRRDPQTGLLRVQKIFCDRGQG